MAPSSINTQLSTNYALCPLRLCGFHLIESASIRAIRVKLLTFGVLKKFASLREIRVRPSPKNSKTGRIWSHLVAFGRLWLHSDSKPGTLLTFSAESGSIRKIRVKPFTFSVPKNSWLFVKLVSNPPQKIQKPVAFGSFSVIFYLWTPAIT